MNPAIAMKKLASDASIFLRFVFPVGALGEDFWMVEYLCLWTSYLMKHRLQGVPRITRVGSNTLLGTTFKAVLILFLSVRVDREWTPLMGLDRTFDGR